MSAIEAGGDASLAEGTLAKVFKNAHLANQVRAKTGYLTGVSALSGYVIDPDSGRTVVFSILTNEKPNSVRLSLVRNVQVQIVEMLDDWLAQKTPRADALGGG